MSEPRIGVVVLAAGASLRMGEPKQLLRYGGETLLSRAARAALDSSCRPAVVVLGSNAEELQKELAAACVRVVVNGEWAEGMSSSIRCGLRALEESAAGGVEAAVFLLCDQPFVTSDIVNRLVEAYRARRAPLVVSEYGDAGEKTRGVPALFSRALFAELEELRGAEGARRVIARHAAEAEVVKAPEAAFDVDTPDDYRALRDREARDAQS
ncbi:MAG TPA: nucleotidyltransferase family protein [Pyrinomonadaceae bacterium]|nr:nucleotidyltransferase family protein [Pyrinomonadaceae bacterium]